MRRRELPPLPFPPSLLGGIGSVYQRAFLTSPTGIFPEYSPINPWENVKLLRDEQKRAVYTCSLSWMQRKANAIDHANCVGMVILQGFKLYDQEPYLVKYNKQNVTNYITSEDVQKWFMRKVASFPSSDMFVRSLFSAKNIIVNQEQSWNKPRNG